MRYNELFFSAERVEDIHPTGRDVIVLIFFQTTSRLCVRCFHLCIYIYIILHEETRYNDVVVLINVEKQQKCQLEIKHLDVYDIVICVCAILSRQSRCYTTGCCKYLANDRGHPFKF